MKAIKLIVDKMPENCNECGLYDYNLGKVHCIFNNNEIKFNRGVKILKRPKDCIIEVQEKKTCHNELVFNCRLPKKECKNCEHYY